MKAAILHAPHTPLAIEDVALADPAPDEVRVRVVASGLCHSDHVRIVGERPCALPALLGHEVSGVVEWAGADVRHVRPGDAVVVGAPFCGMCRECRAGRSNRCGAPPARHGAPRITLAGRPVFPFAHIGGFAEAVLVNGSAVVPVPEGVPIDLAALFGCAVTTGVGAVLNCAQVRPGDSVAVIGCGGVGLNVIQGARIAGAERIIAIDLSPAKLAMAQAFGATDVVAGDADAVAQIVEATAGGVDYAFEAVGDARTIAQALAMLRRGGAAVLVGIPPAGTIVPLPTDLVFRNELRLLSSLVGSVPLDEAVSALARYYLDGRLLLEPLVARRIALDCINEGFAEAARGETARTLITFAPDAPGDRHLRAERGPGGVARR